MARSKSGRPQRGIRIALPSGLRARPDAIALMAGRKPQRNAAAPLTDNPRKPIACQGRGARGYSSGSLTSTRKRASTCRACCASSLVAVPSIASYCPPYCRRSNGRSALNPLRQERRRIHCLSSFGRGSARSDFVPGFVSNVEAIWRSPNRSAFFRRLASFCRVILFDKRGTGMSDRGSQIFTLEQRMHDVQTILNEVGSSVQHYLAFPKADQCPCCMPPPIPNEPQHSFCTAAMPSVPGRPIIRSAGRTSGGNVFLTTLNTTGEPLKE